MQNTKILQSQKRFYGNKKQTDLDVNEDVNSVYINNFDLNKDVKRDNTVVKNVDNTATVSKRKVDMISTSTPSKNSAGEKIVSENRIIDMEILPSAINMLIRPSWRQGNMTLNEVYKKKKGLASFLTFQCIRCKHSVETYTSNRCTANKNSFDVNTRIAYSMRACGQDYAGLEKFSSLMNFPMPMAANNYGKTVKKLLRTTMSVAEVTMQDICDDLHAAEDAEATSIVNTLSLVMVRGIVEVIHL